MTTDALTAPVDPFAPPRRLSVLQDQPLSVSRIRNHGKCPNSFKLTYIDGVPRDPEMLNEFDELLGVSSKIGTVCHAAIEYGYNDALDRGEDRKVTEAEATAFFRRAWTEHTLTDEVAYNDGLRMVRTYFMQNPIVVANVVGVEKKFLLPAAEFMVLGYIDLIERLEPGVYRVTDHKSGKWLKDQDELDNDLQLGVYGWAVRQMFPDAVEVQLRFTMIRHAIVQETTRTKEQCIDAVRYLVDSARQIETRDSFPAVLGMLCSWCGVKSHCKTYEKAHDAEFTDTLIGLCATDDVDSLGDARAAAYAIHKLTEKRYKATDKMIGAAIDAMGVDSVRTESGWNYRPAQKTNKSYPIAKITKAMRQAGVDEPDVAAFTTVVKKRLDEYVDGLDITGARKKLLKATIGAVAESKSGARYMDARQKSK